MNYDWDIFKEIGIFTLQRLKISLKVFAMIMKPSPKNKKVMHAKEETAQEVIH